jgi:phospholipid transport system transporter-binding protein
MIREEGGRLYISGPVTLENAKELRGQGEQYFRGSKLLIDFSEVREVDSAAVSLMLEWSRTASATGTEVRFTNLGDSITSLTDLYGVEDLISVVAP